MHVCAAAASVAPLDPRLKEDTDGSDSLVSCTAPAMAPPQDAFPLQLKHGAVVSEAVGTVLDALPAGAYTTTDASLDHGALILGLRNVVDGPTSLLDTRIGQVRGSSLH